MGLLSRLLPKRLQTRVPLEDEGRLKLMSGVSDNDPCLRVVLDIGQQQLESEFHVAIDPQRSGDERVRACDGMRVAFYFLHSIERVRSDAKAWREEQERREA